MNIYTYLLLLLTAFFVVLVQVVLSALEQSSSYWIRDAIQEEEPSGMSVMEKLSNVSIIFCAASCDSKRLTRNCSAIHVVNDKTLCYLLHNYQSSDGTKQMQPNLPPGTRYSLSECSRMKNPCEPNPCEPPNVCIEILDPDCNQAGFVCRECSPYETGKVCEHCVENHIGERCQVDISNSTYLDGYYFFIPPGVKNFTEVAGMQPNCSDSRKICADRGMWLVTIDSVEKNATITGLGLHDGNCISCMYQMGLRRKSLSTPFYWELDDGPGNITFVNWYYGQPSSETDDFLYTAFMPSIRYSWLDISCNFLAYYICEYKLTTEDEQQRQQTEK